MATLFTAGGLTVLLNSEILHVSVRGKEKNSEQMQGGDITDDIVPGTT